MNVDNLVEQPKQQDSNRGGRNLKTADSGQQSFGGKKNRSTKEEMKISQRGVPRVQDDNDDTSHSPTQR